MPQVPSAFFIADSFLYLDLLLNKRLFKPQPAANGKQAVSRMDLAAGEGVKGKRLYSALRFLWRSSPFGGHDPRIVDLKQYIQASPRKPAIEVLRLSLNRTLFAYWFFLYDPWRLSWDLWWVILVFGLVMLPQIPHSQICFLLQHSGWRSQ